MYSVGLAYLLWLVSGFGILGFHRLYLGKIPSALLWLFTGGLFGIGAIFDFFTLPGQVSEANYRRAFHKYTMERKAEGQQPWRTVNDGKSRIVREKESIEHSILKIAKQNKGILVASEIALAANISVEEAKKHLDMLVSRGHAELRVRQSGSLVYTIPDFTDSNEPLVD